MIELVARTAGKPSNGERETIWLHTCDRRNTSEEMTWSLLLLSFILGSNFLSTSGVMPIRVPLHALAFRETW